MKPDTIVMMSIDDITPYYNNPRRHDNISEVKESIRRVGFRGGIWVDPNHVIIAGHGRFMAAKELGMKEIPVTVISDLSEAEIKYLRIKDNRASDQSSWDEEAYLKEIDELRDMHFDISDIDLDIEPIDFNNLEKYMESEINSEHQAFLDKFKEKHTTDDCFTPPNVYEAVKSWVDSKFKHKGEKVRPFYPGGDYKSFKYPEGCLVLDNPPFSIMAEIVHYYIKEKIDFFLFANGLTLFTSLYEGSNIVVVGATIEYENGAVVNTSFVTNLGKDKVTVSAELYDIIEKAQPSEAKELGSYEFPSNVVTSAMLSKLAKYGANFGIRNVKKISKLDAGVDIFGNGGLISDIDAERVKAEKEKAEKEKAEKFKIRTEREKDLSPQLSERERRIVESLNMLDKKKKVRT